MKFTQSLKNRRWNIEQKLIIKSMKNLGKKKPHNEPCRSPSPDIVNRTIIKNTTIEIQDIRSKMKKAQEKQIKFQLESSLSQAAPSEHNVTLDNKYKQLYEDYNRTKIQNKNLAQQNMLLNKQNKRLSQYDQRSKTFNQLTGALLSKSQNDPLLRERVSSLQQQKKRLQRQLAIQKDRNQQNFKNVDNLRLQEQLLKQQLSRISKNDSYASQAPTSLREQQIRLTLFSNNIFNNYQTTLRARLTELNNRINKVQVQQKIIKEQQYRIISQSRINKTPSSIKSSRKVVPSTGGKMDNKSKQLENSHYRSEKQVYPFTSNSPVQGRMRYQDSLQQIEQQNQHLVGEVKSKDIEIYKLREEKQRLISTLQQLQKDKKTMSTPKFKESSIDDGIFKRMATLQNSSKHYQQTCNELETNLKHYQNQCQRQVQQIKRLTQLQSQHNSQKNQILSFMQHQKKMLKCYENELKEPMNCKICIQKDIEIKQLKQKLKKIQQKHRLQMNELLSRVQNEMEDYERKMKKTQLENNQRFFSIDQKYQKINRLNEQLINQLINVKKMLQYIKQKFQIGDIARFLQQNFSFYSQIQNKFYSERQQYDNAVSAYRAKLLAKEEDIARLEKELNLKIRQVELLQVQLNRVKEINRELQDHQMLIIKSNLNFMNRDKVESKSKQFKQNNSYVVEQAREGTDRLSILYQKVTNNINTQFTATSFY